MVLDVAARFESPADDSEHSIQTLEGSVTIDLGSGAVVERSLAGPFELRMDFGEGLLRTKSHIQSRWSIQRAVRAR